MRKEDRIFGFNFRFQMCERGLSISQVAKDLGYTEQSLNLILDSRGYITLEEKREISSYLGVSYEEMKEERDTKDYELANCYECRGVFKKKESRDKIFEIFDLYCDVLEAKE